MPRTRSFGMRVGLQSGVLPYRYELTPWVWDAAQPESPFWRLPSPAVGGIDLRPLAAQALAGGAPQGFAFCASLQSTGGNAIATVPHMGEAVTTMAMQDAWQSAMGYRPQGAKLVDLLFDQLTNGSDPDGITGPKPLMPTVGGLLELRVGGHSLVKREFFEFGAHSHTGRVRDLLRRDFERLWEATNGDDHCRRVLDYTCEKYGIDDWREFVPQRLHAHVPGRLPHATTINDTFNRANQSGLGTSSGGWSWTLFANASGGGITSIVSNELKFGPAGNGWYDEWRADSDLSSDDHYAQGVVEELFHDFSNPDAGVIFRKDSSATRTFYVAHTTTTTRYLHKYVAGTPTSLGTATEAFSAADLLKGDADGSTIRTLINGVQKVSVTDTAITGNVRTGFRGDQQGSFDGSNFARFDDFEAADLAAAAAIVGRGLTRSKLLNSPLLGRLVG